MKLRLACCLLAGCLAPVNAARAQLKPQTGELLEFYPIDSVSRLEARRAAVGLPPMSVYLCMMRGFTGRSAKFPP